MCLWLANYGRYHTHLAKFGQVVLEETVRDDCLRAAQGKPALREVYGNPARTVGGVYHTCAIGEKIGHVDEHLNIRLKQGGPRVSSPLPLDDHHDIGIVQVDILCYQQRS